MKKILIASTCAVIILLAGFSSVASAQATELNDILSNQIVDTDDIPKWLLLLGTLIDFLITLPLAIIIRILLAYYGYLPFFPFF